jgi:hypothetical protein
MKRALVLIALLMAAATHASQLSETGPLEPHAVPWQHLWDGVQPVDRGQSDGQSITLNTTEPDQALIGGGGTATPSESDDPAWQHPPRDWGDDILVDDFTYESSGRISVDNDQTTGDIYVCLLNRDATAEGDTAHVRRSTDGGASWSEFPLIRGTSGNGNLVDVQLLVGKGPGDTTWVYLFNASDGSAGLRVRMMTPNGSEFRWVTISPEATVVRIAVDRNTENPQHLFCFWEEADGDVRGMSSTDGGYTWGNATYVSGARRDLAFAAGGDGYGYVAYCSNTADSTYYRIGRFNNNLVSPDWVFNYVDSNYQRHFRTLSITADRTAPGASQTAVTLVTYRHDNNNIGPRYAYTANGGTSWTSTFWPVTNQGRETWLALHPRIRRSYDSPLFRAMVSMRETTTNWDTIVYAFTRATDPTTWEDRTQINDYRNTGEVPHDLSYSSETSGGFVAYRQYGMGTVWMDGWNFTGVAANPMPAQQRSVSAALGGEANLALAHRARVTAALYDQNGRKAAEIFSGTLEAGEHHLRAPDGLARGVYFLRVAIDGRNELAKLVRLQ